MSENAQDSERRLRGEDARLVAECIEDGRIPSTRAHFWLSALARDRVGSRALLAAVIPSPNNGGSGASGSEMEDVYCRVVGGPRAANRSGKRIAPGLGANNRTPPDLDGDEGLYSHVAWRMGGPLRAGLEPPPGTTTYWVDPNAPKIVVNSDGTGCWVDPGQERREKSLREQAVRDKALREQQAEREAQARASYRADRDRRDLL
ncbi:hypothetical protein [Mycobacterium colombiense]|uniref:hypothetical protein n=1 Tax=Mycobacterium colombiense TaxID=339268 RepID=UPI000B20E54D|nr:hypothetical protein [Mycobacterium colombiense]